MPALPNLLPLLPLAAAEPSADFTGLAVVAGVLVALAVAAFFLLRKPPRPGTTLPPAEDARAGIAAEGVDEQARRRAKELRRAAQGAVRVGADGSVAHEDAIDLQAEADVPAAAPSRDAVDREKVSAGLQKTRKEGFVGMLGKLFAGKQIDASILDEVEEVLYRADLGVAATKALLDAVRRELSRGELTSAERVWASLETRAKEILAEVAQGDFDLPPSHGPAVLMVVGVNGSGKTTTIGKLAHRYAGQGRKVLVAAGDTFRAAAVDQLEVWCERAGVELHRGKEGADPASVCYAAIERAKAEGFDLVICDTAGRLHTNANLMAELEKVHRVIGKAHAGAPHECMLVLDSTMGQNAVAQARQFGESLKVTAIALTKLDGTAKGGVVLAIAETLKIPVRLIGVGEKMEDLRDFDADVFTAALFAKDA
ncbi:MAG: hypothetical protein RIT45_2520 [Pseudomonadota bacterium]|jgi:fused signal recognition particle receptor